MLTFVTGNTITVDPWTTATVTQVRICGGRTCGGELLDYRDMEGRTGTVHACLVLHARPAQRVSAGRSVIDVVAD